MEEFREYYDTCIEPQIKEFDSKIIGRNKKKLYFIVVFLNIIIGICMYFLGNSIDIIYICANILLWGIVTKSFSQTILYTLLPTFTCYFSMDISRMDMLTIIMPILLIYMILVVYYIPQYKKSHVNKIRENVMNSIFNFINKKNSFFIQKRNTLKIKSQLRRASYKLFDYSKFRDLLHIVNKECMRGEINGMKVDICHITIKNTIETSFRLGRRFPKVAVVFDGLALIINTDDICDMHSEYIIRRKINKEKMPILPPLKINGSSLYIEEAYASDSNAIKYGDIDWDFKYDRFEWCCINKDESSDMNFFEIISDEVIRICSSFTNKNDEHVGGLHNVIDHLMGITISGDKICVLLDNNSKYYSFVNNLSTDCQFESIYKYYLDLQVCSDIINIFKNI